MGDFLTSTAYYHEAVAQCSGQCSITDPALFRRSVEAGNVLVDTHPLYWMALTAGGVGAFALFCAYGRFLSRKGSQYASAVAFLTLASLAAASCAVVVANLFVMF